MSTSTSQPRPGVRRSVFLSQLVIGVCVLVLAVLVLILDVSVIARPTFFAGVILVFALTGVAACIDWSPLPPWTIACIPILDILAVALLRAQQPAIAVTFFYIFPVIWLASYFGRRGAFLGAALSSVSFIVIVVVETSRVAASDIPRILVVPIALAFVATVTYRASARNRAQRVILDRQSGLLEAALQRSKGGERLLDEVLEALPFGVVRMNAAGRMIFANGAYRGWMARHRAAGDAPASLYAADKRTLVPDSERPFARAARGEEFSEVIVWMGGPESREQIAFAITGHRLPNNHSTGAGVVVVVRDITSELLAVEARDELMASVTHELKNPLTSVTGFVELALEDPNMSDATRDQLAVVLKSSDRMLTLVSELLDASRERAVAFTLTHAPMDLADVVRDAMAAVRPRTQGIELRHGSLESAPIIGDAFRLRQVVDNLLSNAIKYNNPGGSVTVSIVGSRGAVQLIVADTGRGLTEQELSVLFTRYYRAPSTHGVGGTGLGLSISRDIVRQHLGDITVISIPGEGTTFTVTLPTTAEEEGEA
ncbi:sensor histidine kinase [Paramicrobacterium fandaimingii]|uniref:sensor histidine kinase n=1 Tax=Paramicrobacterium fandaimingii TaxID=2708079 RepID=UPI001420284A|nr:sensor histidine kinase [Microbacterium fandaimingii]